MSTILSVEITALMPTARPDMAAMWNVLGTQALLEAKALVAAGIINPLYPLPTFSRLYAATNGTNLHNVDYVGYDLVKGFSSAFDSCQAAVAAAYLINPPPAPPVPLPAIAMIPIIKNAFITSVQATKPDWTITTDNPNQALFFNAFANFIFNSYF